MIDAYSRRVVGWSISDRITSEIVVDALEMARWQRRPQPDTIVHADRGAQGGFNWAFGHRPRQAGRLGSVGRVASWVDNALIESFWSTMQRELLYRHDWESRTELASAMFEWIEGLYNPRRRHSSLGDVSPVASETLHNRAAAAARSTHHPCPRDRLRLPQVVTSDWKIEYNTVRRHSALGYFAPDEYTPHCTHEMEADDSHNDRT